MGERERARSLILDAARERRRRDPAYGAVDLRRPVPTGLLRTRSQDGDDRHSAGASATASADFRHVRRHLQDRRRHSQGRWRQGVFQRFEMHLRKVYGK